LEDLFVWIFVTAQFNLAMANQKSEGYFPSKLGYFPSKNSGTILIDD